MLLMKYTLIFIEDYIRTKGGKEIRNRTIFLRILLFIFIISISATASAREITVDDDSGADFRSIQEAVNNSVPGDIIIVRPGTYTENVLVNITGLTIRSESNNGNAQVKPLNESKSTFLIKADSITISGLNITGANKDYKKGAIILYSDMNNVTGNTIENGYILLGPERSGNLIAENKVLNGGRIHISCCGRNNTVSGNTVSNSSTGIYEWDQGADIRNNRITDCDYGIELGFSSSGRIDNNTILNCDVGILLGEACDVDIINNTIMSCAECGIFDTENNGRRRIYNNYFMSLSQKLI
ncbi:cell surface protein [Methanosarcina siciliae T4/M]|uniref:Cell surface protein n=2 Tax=Methanosarcina siciliae TaxID=38027 RepID=A0A0E3P5Y8_9EURY|nr:cell surface protein [Methanosarcina siciliae T4/M]